MVISDSAAVLVLGTYNEKKRGELAGLLAPLGLELKTLAEFSEAIEVVEDGASFAENAQLKATQQARNLDQWVLGEDSGLVVDALGGAPGIYSARFAGEGASDQENNRRLLAELGETPLQRRTAHYVCHMSVADPTGQVRADCEATCQGRIRFEPSGTNGFGYDPLFELIEYHRTFGQLGPAVKAVLSHRARTMRKLAGQLSRLLECGRWK